MRSVGNCWLVRCRLFLNIGTTFAIFSLSRNIPLFSTWFITIVKCLIIEVVICFKNMLDMSSYPQLLLAGKFSIIVVTVCSFASFNVNVWFCQFLKIVCKVFGARIMYVDS